MNEYRCGRCGALLPFGAEPQVLPRCPSCREPYGFPSLGTDSPTPPSRTSLALGLAMGAGALVLAGFLGAAGWILTRRSDLSRSPVMDRPPVVRAPRPPAAEEPEGVSEENPVPARTPAAPPREPPSPPTRISAEETRAVVVRVNRIIARNNMAGIVAAVLQAKGRFGEAEDVRTLLRTGEQEIGLELQRLPAHFDSSRIADHHRSGDRLVAFGASSLDAAAPQHFAEALTHWLRHYQVGSMVPATLIRDGRAVQVLMYFAEAGAEMTDLSAIVLGKPAPSAPLPKALLEDLRARLAVLPAAYVRALPPADSGQLERLLARGEGSSEDVAFLQGAVQAGFLPRAEAEYGRIKARASELDEKVRSVPGNDVLHFKDGRRLEGRIEEESQDSIRFRTSLGAVRLDRRDLRTVEKGTASVGEFRVLFVAARGRPDELLPLIAWCRSRNLSLHKELVCWSLLAADPSRPEARRELGLSSEVFQLPTPDPRR